MSKVIKGIKDSAPTVLFEVGETVYLNSHPHNLMTVMEVSSKGLQLGYFDTQGNFLASVVSLDSAARVLKKVLI